ncbi:MAG TPA: monovalent cation:proton antiporter family protein [Anaerolineales bacterium]|nr:monovalent cation:proton antiporter family protein [Anaerolineales bacterium]
MEETLSFSPLLLVIFLAFLVPLVLSRFRQVRLPIVVGEILAGILVGRSGLGWVQHHNEILELLAGFGFVFLMFLSGMEIDFSNISLARSEGSGQKGKAWGPVPLGSLSFGLTLIFSVGLSFVLARSGLVRNPWLMGLILSTTSLGVVMPVLKEKGLSRGQYGQTLLITALIADFATMLLITVVVAVMASGLTFDILLIGLLFLAFFLMYHFGMLFFNRISGVRRVFEELSHASAQIKVRAAFTMMLIFVALSEVVGTEVILGAFLAGAIVSLLKGPEDDDLVDKLEAIGFGFFIPIFFIMVGVDFNLTALLSSQQAILLVPVLLLAAIAVKVLPSFVYRFKFNWQETFAAGALLSARLSLIIAASAIGLRMGVISEPVNAAIILVAIITVTAAPLVFSRFELGGQAGEAGPILVAGANDLGLRVAEQLKAHREDVIVIDPDESRVARALARGLKSRAAQLDGPNHEVSQYFDKAVAIVCTHRDTEKSYRICQIAHSSYGISRLVAQVNEASEIERFRNLGVNTVNPATDRATLLTLLARNPSAYHLLTRVDDDKQVVEVLVGDGQCDGKALYQLKLPGDLLVLALRRNGELLIPHGDTQLNCGDHLTLVGSVESIDTARHMFMEVK